MFEYYTFLHHSQTGVIFLSAPISLNTIRFYIILKPVLSGLALMVCLNTIRFYIILKPVKEMPGIFHRLNTIRFYIILKPQIQK